MKREMVTKAPDALSQYDWVITRWRDDCRLPFVLDSYALYDTIAGVSITKFA